MRKIEASSPEVNKADKSGGMNEACRVFMGSHAFGKFHPYGNFNK